MRTGLVRFGGFVLGWLVLVAAFAMTQPAPTRWLGYVNGALVVAAPAVAWWLAARTGASTGRFAVFATLAFVASLLGAALYLSVLGGIELLLPAVFPVALAVAYGLVYIDGRVAAVVGVGGDSDTEADYEEHPYG